MGSGSNGKSEDENLSCIQLADPEYFEEILVCADLVKQEDFGIEKTIVINRFSNVVNLSKVTARVCRFARNIKVKNNERNYSDDSDDKDCK